MEEKHINFDEELGTVPLVPALQQAAQREIEMERLLKQTRSWRKPTKKYASKEQKKAKRKQQKASRRKNRKR